MRGPAPRIRWTVLTLLLAGVGAFVYPSPPARDVTGGEAALVLASGTERAALPAPSWTLLPDPSTELLAPRARRTTGTPPRIRIPLDGAVAGHPTPGPGLPRRSSASLLGLLAAPANAPPTS